jgi:hypothetical protein
VSLEPRVADLVIEALRLGEVPDVGLEAIGSGIDAYLEAFDRELQRVADGAGRIRFVRGDFGTGKTFFLKTLGARARAVGFATAYVRISYPDVPLGKIIALYHAVTRALQTRHQQTGAFRETIDGWLYRAAERLTDPAYGIPVREDDPRFDESVEKQLKTMLGSLFDQASTYAQVVAAYSRALSEERADIARGLLAWLAGDEHVDASVKRYAHVSGKLGQFDGLPMFAGLSTTLVQSGSRGLVVLIDEGERVLYRPAPQRADAYRTLQNLIGALSTELRSILFVVAGTTAFFEHRKGISEVEPLRQRIETTFDDRFPDLDAVQVRLPPFDRARLQQVGRLIVGLFDERYPGNNLRARVDDQTLTKIADDVIGAFGGDIAVAPRQFFRRLVSTLSKARQYSAYDPRSENLDQKTLADEGALSAPEREALTGVRANDPIEREAALTLDL